MDAIWTRYNGALLPTLPPDKELCLTKQQIKKCVKDYNAVFARWTSDFDCGHETEWWFCIRGGKSVLPNSIQNKDTAFVEDLRIPTCSDFRILMSSNT